jgi:hypothetical protein
MSSLHQTRVYDLGCRSQNASVVRGGGETRRKTAIAFALPFAIALMLAQPVSATGPISDAEGDVPWSYDTQTGETKDQIWSSNPPIVQVGYFDMISYSLSLDGDYYTFWMKLAAELPVAGDALPSGTVAGEWAMWIDPAPWNPTLGPGGSLFMIKLTYNGSGYAACLVNYATKEETPLESSDHLGSELWISFHASVVDGQESLWWCASTRSYTGSGVYSFRFVDWTDWDVADGQEWYSIPWPS